MSYLSFPREDTYAPAQVMHTHVHVYTRGWGGRDIFKTYESSCIGRIRRISVSDVFTFRIVTIKDQRADSSTREISRFATGSLDSPNTEEIVYLPFRNVKLSMELVFGPPTFANSFVPLAVTHTFILLYTHTQIHAYPPRLSGERLMSMQYYHSQLAYVSWNSKRNTTTYNLFFLFSFFFSVTL